MAKRIIGSGCRLGWLTGRSVEDGCIRWDGDHRREGAVLGVNVRHPIVTNGTLWRSGAKLRALMW